MCNTYRFQSIQNNCKGFDKCWHWNHRIDEEASTYKEITKWACQRKKVYWPQTTWGYSKAMLSWKKQNISYCWKLSYPQFHLMWK